MEIYKSRFTPDATGDEIKLMKGEKVKYRLLNNSIIDAIIDSEIGIHAKHQNLVGYAAICMDDKKRYFLDAKRIIWWEGKGQLIKEAPSKISGIGDN